MQVKFVMFKGGQRKDIELAPGQTTIGRREDCGLRIPANEVSRAHCQITVDDATVSVKDLGSANGTFVNDQRVNEQRLKPGDVLRVGPASFTVQINGKPAQIVSPEELAAAMGDDSGDLFGEPEAAAVTRIGSGKQNEPLEELELLDLDLDEETK